VAAAPRNASVVAESPMTAWRFSRTSLVQLQKEMPDLALMDIHLKGAMDGTETARILRERFDIPVIYLTAHADRETLDRAKIAVPLGYVTKPFRHPDLRASIEMALFKHHEDAKNKQREHILTSTLQAIGVGILSVDRRAAVTLLNPAAEGWTAWTAKEAVGKSFGEVFPLVDARSGQRIELPVGAVFGGGKLLELRDEILLLARNGTKRPIEGTVAPVLDHQNAGRGRSSWCPRGRHRLITPDFFKQLVASDHRAFFGRKQSQ